MKFIQAWSLTEAWETALRLLEDEGITQNTRLGRVVSAPYPVVTLYNDVRKCVLIDPHRDPNPAFHFIEGLWMLAGRKDTKFLDTYVRDFTKKVGVDGHGAYGYRWRHHFPFNQREPEGSYDQIELIVERLRKDPNDRRIVLAMWDPTVDIEHTGPDIPCNTHAYFRVLGNRLHLTVCCRSNDIVWGCYGSNAVHFSFLLQYIAARVGLLSGTYAQISNNWHAYTDVIAPIMWERKRQCYERDIGLEFAMEPLVRDPDTFDTDLDEWFNTPVSIDRAWSNPCFHTADCLHTIAVSWRTNPSTAITAMNRIWDKAWRIAARVWLARRVSLEQVVNADGGVSWAQDDTQLPESNRTLISKES